MLSNGVDLGIGQNDYIFYVIVSDYSGPSAYTSYITDGVNFGSTTNDLEFAAMPCSEAIILPDYEDYYTWNSFTGWYDWVDPGYNTICVRRISDETVMYELSDIGIDSGSMSFSWTYNEICRACDSTATTNLLNSHIDSSLTISQTTAFDLGEGSHDNIFYFVGPKETDPDGWPSWYKILGDANYFNGVSGNDLEFAPMSCSDSTDSDFEEFLEDLYKEKSVQCIFRTGYYQRCTLDCSNNPWGYEGVCLDAYRGGECDSGLESCTWALGSEPSGSCKCAFYIPQSPINYDNICVRRKSDGRTYQLDVSSYGESQLVFDFIPTGANCQACDGIANGQCDDILRCNVLDDPDCGCASGDGSCPPGCSPSTDSDCNSCISFGCDGYCPPSCTAEQDPDCECIDNYAPHYYCKDDVCIPGANCGDSDDGKNYFVKGSTSGTDIDGNPVTGTDYCTGKTSMVEYYCNGSYIKSEQYSCLSGEICVDGACVEGSIPACDGGMGSPGLPTCNDVCAFEGRHDGCLGSYPAGSNCVDFSPGNCGGTTPVLCQCYDLVTPLCTDTDGMDPTNKGTCSSNSIDFDDYCTGGDVGGVLREFYCMNGDCITESIYCDPGYECRNGACVFDDSCSDTDMTAKYPDGKHYFKNGRCTDGDPYDDPDDGVDYCAYSNTAVVEHYCDLGSCTTDIHTCANGCENQKCLCVSDGDCDLNEICDENGACVSDSGCPDTCSSLGFECGTVCGASCGDCIGDEVCVAGQCVPIEGLLILINQDIYSQISNNLNQFRNDLINEGFEVREYTINSDSTPLQIRNLLNEYYQDGSWHMKGAILIGNIPAAYTTIITGIIFQGDYSLSMDATDLYYMNLHSDFNEDPSDYISCSNPPPGTTNCYEYDSMRVFADEFKVYIKEDQIKSEFYLDIWVSRIMAHNLLYTGYDEISIINNYLQRNHDYRTGIDSAKGNALILGDDVEGNSAIFDFTENLEYLFNQIIVENVNEDQYLSRLSLNPSEFVYTGYHGAPRFHQTPEGIITVDELNSVQKNSIVYFENSCSVCRWDEIDGKNYIGGSYVFDPIRTKGLLAIGEAGVGGYNYYNLFSKYLMENEDASYGASFVYWQNISLQDIYGMNNHVLLGDPTLKPSCRWEGNCVESTPMSAASVSGTP